MNMGAKYMQAREPYYFQKKGSKKKTRKEKNSRKKKKISRKERGKQDGTRCEDVKRLPQVPDERSGPLKEMRGPLRRNTRESCRIDYLLVSMSDVSNFKVSINTKMII